jgi:hypothetical protein
MSVPNCVDFPQLLVDQQPIYDELIVFDIRPTDSWVMNVATGEFPAASGVEHRLDRFRHVFPNTTKVWNRTQYASCVGTACDKDEHQIGWGAERLTYYLEEQSWQTPLLCFDSMMHVTDAEQNFEYIITDILRPATSAIQSMFLRKRTLGHTRSENLLTLNATLDRFTFVWTVVGDEEYFLDTSVAPNNVFKLVPQALQRMFNPLMLRGYAGKNPFKETAPFIELVTDIETCWELDKLGGSTGVGGTPSVGGNWRFTQWDAANSYWRYGFSGQIGNFMVRVDPMQLRFNFVGDLGAAAAPNRYRYQLVLPYVNQVTSGAGGDPGLGSVDNPDFQLAQFALTFIFHKKAFEALFADSKPINPEMPFSARNWAGKWEFVRDNLGATADGCVIENKRRNKGQFIADFKLAIRPLWTEFLVSYFHKREPMCIPEIPTCNPSPGYPVQQYGSANDLCPVDEV